MSNAHQDNEPRYIVIEVPGEARAAEFEKVAEAVMDRADELREIAGVDVFAFVPHSHQEDVLRELFGPYKQKPEPKDD